MDGEQNGTQALARIEQLGGMPPRLDVVLYSEIDAHKNLPFLVSKKWEAVQDVGVAVSHVVNNAYTWSGESGIVPKSVSIHHFGVMLPDAQSMSRSLP